MRACWLLCRSSRQALAIALFRGNFRHALRQILSQAPSDLARLTAFQLQHALWSDTPTQGL